MGKAKQVQDQIRNEIARGRCGAAGDRFLTVREIAKRFGVSLTTAQKVVKSLKDEGLLIADSATSPARISAAAFRSAVLAKGGEGSPRRLGLVVTDITNPFFSRLCRFIQLAAAERDYQVLVASSDSDFDREQRIIRGFLEIGVEGLLICPGLDAACVTMYRALLEQGMKLVFVSRRVEGIDADFVVAHNFVGGALVAGHFLSMGYRSFGYIGFGARLKRDERLQGFRMALFQQDLELPESHIVYGDGRNVEHGYRAMKELIEGRGRLRAVFALNDLLAIGALHYCQEQAIAVPAEVAIAGFDNLPESCVTRPPLTTVAYPIQSIARLAVQSLDDRICGTGDRPANRILLEPRLVVRESTDPQAKISCQESETKFGTEHSGELESITETG